MTFLDDVRHRHPPTGPAGSSQQQPVDLWPQMVVWEVNPRSAWDLGERPKVTRTTFAYIYKILGWSSFPSIRPVIRPSKFLIPEEEDDGTGGRWRLMVAAHVHVILLAQFVLTPQNCFCVVCRNLAERAMEGQRWRYEIVQTLIVDIEPDETIKRAMTFLFFSFDCKKRTSRQC